MCQYIGIGKLVFHSVEYLIPRALLLRCDVCISFRIHWLKDLNNRSVVIGR